MVIMIEGCLIIFVGMIEIMIVKINVMEKVMK